MQLTITTISLLKAIFYNVPIHALFKNGCPYNLRGERILLLARALYWYTNSKYFGTYWNLMFSGKINARRRNTIRCAHA